MKRIFPFFLLLFIVSYSPAQEYILKSDLELAIPTGNPWGVTCHDDFFWISNAENGNIVKIHKDLETTGLIKAPRKQITGLTFVGDDLWVLVDAWDTIGLPHFSSINSQMFKIDPKTGEKLDSLIVPYYNHPKVTDKFLMGVSYFDSSFFVSYYGGWEDCVFRIDPYSSSRQSLCCAHPAGLETINGELWTVRHNAEDGTGNFILPLSVSNSLIDEDWTRRMVFDFFASDLTYDGSHYWLCDPYEKKLKRMVIDTIYNDTIHVDTLCNYYHINQLEIIPANPTINDEIKVVCHSSFKTGGCDLIEAEVFRHDSGLYVYASHMVGTAQHICYSVDTVTIGRLPAGYHNLQYSLSAINLNCSPVSYSREFYVRDAASACFTIDKLEIIPQNPTIKDEIKIVCHSTFTSGDCRLKDTLITWDSTGIHLYAYHEVGMLTYICHSSDTITLGKLPYGYHVLNYSLTAINLNCGSVQEQLEFFVTDTLYTKVYLEIIPEQPVAGEEVKIITHGVCYLETHINIQDRHITILGYYNSCILYFAPCGIDTISLGFLSPDPYTLDYYLIDECVTEPKDSLAYYEKLVFKVHQSVKAVNVPIDSGTGIFPNPASEKMYIKNPYPLNEMYIEILDLKGQLMQRWEFYNQGDIIELNIQEINPGIYLLRTFSNDYIETYKVIIQ